MGDAPSCARQNAVYHQSEQLTLIIFICSLRPECLTLNSYYFYLQPKAGMLDAQRKNKSIASLYH